MAQARPLVREGFHLKENIFVLPKETVAFDPQTKRDMTICNLFINHNMSIPNIQHLLDEDAGRIVNALINHRILEDRRQRDLRTSDSVNRRRAPKLQVVVDRPRWSQKRTPDVGDAEETF